MVRRLSLLLAAGAAGGLANALVVWWLADVGVARALGLAVGAALTPGFLYPRIVWGGLWGLVFALPVSAGGWVRRGLLLSLAPSLVQLLVVLPFRDGRGLLGLELGGAMPLFVLVANAVWGLAASGWLRAARG